MFRYINASLVCDKSWTEMKAKVDESLSTSLLAKHLHKTKSSLAHIKMVHVIKDDSVSNIR